MAFRKEDQSTTAFLRMAAVQLREIAEHAPDIARELRQIAEQLEIEAADIERRSRL